MIRPDVKPELGDARRNKRKRIVWGCIVALSVIFSMAFVGCSGPNVKGENSASTFTYCDATRLAELWDLNSPRAAEERMLEMISASRYEELSADVDRARDLSPDHACIEPHVLHGHCAGPRPIEEVSFYEDDEENLIEIAALNDDPLTDELSDEFHRDEARAALCGTELTDLGMRVALAPDTLPCREPPASQISAYQTFIEYGAEYDPGKWCAEHHDSWDLYECFESVENFSIWRFFPTDPTLALEVDLNAGSAHLWQWDPDRSCAVAHDLVTFDAQNETTLDKVATSKLCGEDMIAKGDASLHSVETPYGIWSRVRFRGSCVYDSGNSDETYQTGLGATLLCTSSPDAGFERILERWTIQTPLGGVRRVASLDYEFDEWNEPDSDCALEVDLVRTQDDAEMVKVEGDPSMTLGVSDIEARIAECQELGSKRCTQKRFAREVPSRQVSVASFLIDRREVSMSQYQKCVEAGACSTLDASSCLHQGGSDDKRGVPDLYERSEFPARCVTHAEASAYCAWASARLPTEAEWELAAQRYTRSSFLEGGAHFQKTKPRDTRADDQHGVVLGGEWFEDAPVYDLLGNVYEWVDGGSCDYQDWPEGKSRCDSAKMKVVRGGGFTSDAGALTPTYRRFNAANTRADTHGFRCAADIVE